MSTAVLPACQHFLVCSTLTTGDIHSNFCFVVLQTTHRNVERRNADPYARLAASHRRRMSLADCVPSDQAAKPDAPPLPPPPVPPPRGQFVRAPPKAPAWFTSYMDTVSLRRSLPLCEKLPFEFNVLALYSSCHPIPTRNQFRSTSLL